jgi:predicted small integral membrane protein
MAGVPEGVGPPWRTTNPLVVWAGVAVIVLGKLAALLGGLAGGALMLRQVRAPAAEFHRAKQWAVAGCAFAFGLMFFGFTVVAEAAFWMFFDPGQQGTGALAFRFAASLALVALFVAQPEPD